MGLIQKVVEKVRLRWLKRNEYESLALRRWFKEAYRVEVGLYSYGCFDRWRVPGPTKIGRYCSFAGSVRILDSNHPMDALSTHPYLYARSFGVVPDDRIDADTLVIEDDVWLSHNVTIAPGCKHIGRGAIIGAGAVVTKDVPAYAVVTGMPAQVLRYRFSPEMQAALEASRWWELSKAELAELGRTDPELLYHPTVAKLAGLAERKRRP